MILPPVTNEYDSSTQVVFHNEIKKTDDQNLKLDQDNFLTTGSICLQDSSGDWYRLGVNIGGIESLLEGDWQDSSDPPSTSGTWEETQKHYHVPQYSTSGSGSGAEFTVHTYAEDSIHAVIITNSGLGYAVSDTIVIHDPGNTSHTATLTVGSIKEGRLTVTKLAGSQLDANGRPLLASTNPYS